ncbi:hypothetical protein [Polaromonas hydrogenivorans]|uniref:Methyltransferase domain-containing protein n=1 Tax=Polaromonas hydrogenivorans TaxID=335476 RepID=A0AAU7LVI9_9BURK
MMPRVVAAETLDGLAEDDPAAMRSRRDLQRVHRVMGTRGIMLRALRDFRALAVSRSAETPLRILELGAGDGSLMLGVARALQGKWPAVEITLLDRQNLVSRPTIAGYARLGWRATPQVMDVFDWASSRESERSGHVAYWDVIVANLFLHHFEGPQLAALLAAIESRTESVFACEPRRARLALAGSHLIGALGANAVTREDAVLSVHAGFRDSEISALWPGNRPGWTLDEYPASLFSHCFCAQRSDLEAAAAPS